MTSSKMTKHRQYGYETYKNLLEHKRQKVVEYVKHCYKMSKNTSK